LKPVKFNDSDLQAWLAGKVKAEQTITGLIEALSDEFWQVRGIAALALGSLKAHAASIRRPHSLSSQQSCKDVVTALGEIGYPGF
jgi:HEAT repeat protein